MVGSKRNEWLAAESREAPADFTSRCGIKDSATVHGTSGHDFSSHASVSIFSESTTVVTTPQLVEHFFRHEHGRVVSTLTRVLGVRHLDLVEDVVQAAMVRALQGWAQRGVPDDPAGWLFRVAKNLAVDALRREKTWLQSVKPACATPAVNDPQLADRVQFADEIADDQLRMLFVCCHPAVPAESHVALALKTLCGFSNQEISRSLLTSEANVQKRLTRAKERLRGEQLDVAFAGDLFSRVDSVHSVLYLFFNEGYHSCHAEHVVRGELVDEAIRLTKLLSEHPAGDVPPTRALLALMYFHSARLAAREDDAGRLLLLSEQDRSKWDQTRVRMGLDWLARSAEGWHLSRYHLEAGIAAEHTQHASFAETNWPRILQQYDLLVEIAPSAIHELNRAIAIAHVHGADAGLDALQKVKPQDIPLNYHLWESTLGELHRRAGCTDLAFRHLQRALEMAPTRQERELLERRITELTVATKPIPAPTSEHPKP